MLFHRIQRTKAGTPFTEPVGEDYDKLLRVQTCKTFADFHLELEKLEVCTNVLVTCLSLETVSSACSWSVLRPIAAGAAV